MRKAKQTTVNELRESTATTAPCWADCQISHGCLTVGFQKTHLGHSSTTVKRLQHDDAEENIVLWRGSRLKSLGYSYLRQFQDLLPYFKIPI